MAESLTAVPRSNPFLWRSFNSFTNISLPLPIFSPLLRTSRHFYRVFCSLSRRLQHDLVTRVACNAFHPAVLPIVVLLALTRSDMVISREELNESYRAPFENSDDEEIGRTRGYRRRQENDFMGKYPNLQEVFLEARKLVTGRHGQLESCINGPERIIGRYKDRLNGVCRLWSIVEWFIGDFCEKRSSLLQDLALEKKKRNDAQEVTNSKVNVINNHDENNNSSNATGCGIKVGSLSHREYGRLQRGFLLFELHRQLFNPYTCADERKALLTGCLSYMEIAELRTVYDYLIEQVDKIVDTRECHANSLLVEEIRLRKEQCAKNNKTDAIKRLDAELEAIDRRKSRLQPIRRYKVNRYQYKQHAFLIEQGLPFCRHLLARMTFRQQTAMLWVCRTRLRQSSLNKILHATRRQDWVSEHLTPHDEESIRMGLHKPDALLDQGRPERLLRWLSRLEADEISPSSPKRTKVRLLLHKRIFTNYAWRQLGWFIWDDWRLDCNREKSEKSTSPMTSIGELDEKEDQFWKRELTMLYHIWLRDQHKRRVVKIQWNDLDQALRSFEIANDYSLPEARRVRFSVADDDDDDDGDNNFGGGSAAGQDLESVENFKDILLTQIDYDRRYQPFPFKDWLEEIDYLD